MVTNSILQTKQWSALPRLWKMDPPTVFVGIGAEWTVVDVWACYTPFQRRSSLYSQWSALCVGYGFFCPCSSSPLAATMRLKIPFRFLGTSERSLTVDSCHVTRYIAFMIKSFFDSATEELYRTGRTRKLPSSIQPRACRKLDALHAAVMVEDLRVPPGNRLHALHGDREGQYSISINKQWRICFSFRDGDAFNVEVCDYH